ncbi:hypothetical protein D9M68_997680 [compost metagenome]
MMEFGNSLVAACSSFASGALIAGIGWDAVNLGMLPLVALALLMLLPVRRRLAAE